MTGKERLLLAFRNKQPDIVPIAPDIDLIGMRWWHEKTKKPWWNVFLYGDPSFEDVYIEANKKLGCEIWDYFGRIRSESGVKSEKKIIAQTDAAITREVIARTPYGDLRNVTAFPRDAPPWSMEKHVKDIHRDWPKLKWVMEQATFYPEITASSKVGESGVIGVTGRTPFPDFWVSCRGAEKAILDFYDYPELMDDIFRFYRQYVSGFIKIAVQAKPEVIWIPGSSSSLSLISPEIYRKYSLPIVREVTELCKKAGVLSHAHTCGKSGKVVEMNYQETDLNIMEPLEGPPTGDMDLKAAKEKFGDKFCLKGNINTVLLHKGKPKDIKAAVQQAIADAAPGGGFVLSTGDSPGSNTPDANICAMVEAGREYGKYRLKCM